MKIKQLSALTTMGLFVLSIASTCLGQEPVYIEGKYIIQAASSNMLTDKSVELIQELASEPVNVREKNKHIVVLTTIKRHGKDLCTKARAGKRQALKKDAAKIAAKRFVACERDQLLFSSRTPNDTYYYLQWGAKNNVEGIDMRLEAAWDRSTGTRDTVVGVIDSGVDYNHPDLQANMWRNPGEIAGNGLDDDGNGVIDDVYGYNAITNSGNPMDDNGHGTHCSGTIGGLGNNSTGVVGVSWQVQIVAIKFLASNGSGSLSDAVKAIDYATGLKQRGINIVGTNNSWGGGGYSQSLYDAIARANTAGLLFIAAAGNNSQNIDASPSYPAAYSNDNVISVAALSRNGSIASFSNYGAQNVDVAAPGVSIASTYPGNGYVYMDGTSMAAPHVTGLIALAKSYSASSTSTELKNALFASISPLANLNGLMRFPGIVNAQGMLSQLAYNPPATSTPVVPPTATSTPLPTPTRTPTPTPTVTPTPLPGYYSARVLATDSQGLPLAGVQLELRAENGKSYFATTGDNGLAVMSQILGPTNYTLIAQKAGSTFNNQQGRITSDVSLSLQPTASKLYTLSAHVIREDKSPIAGVLVDMGSLGTVSTDSNGEAKINVPVGTVYSISVQDSSLDFDFTFATGEILGSTTRLFVAK